MQTAEILKIAYGASPYNSVVCIGCHKTGTDGIYTLAYIPTAELDPDKIKIKKDRDYYITANTLTKRERKSENLFSLRNIVIDIDCHGSDLTEYERNELLQEFIFRMFRDCEIPTPNIIHYTGRGVQLWWCLEEMSRELLFLYKATTQRIIDRLKALQEEYPDFKALDIDGASKNAIGFFRLFGSYNTKTGTRTSTDIKKAEKYDIHFLLENVEIIEQEAPQKQPQAYIDNNYLPLNYKRANFIKWLISHRNAPAGCEMRDKILFLFYNAMVQTTTAEQGKKATIQLNQQFKEPLDRLENIFSYIDEKGFLKFKNETWLEFLGANDYERSAYIMQEKKHNGTRDISRKMSKDERNAKILEMKKAGKTHTEIAETLGISINTITNFLKTITPKVDRKAKIEEYRAKGLKISEICKLLGISKQTYYNILKKGD